MKISSFLFYPWLITFCLCEVSEEKKTKLLSNFIDYFNNQSNKNETICDGYLRSISEVDETTYNIEVTLNTKGHDPKQIKCSSTVREIPEGGISIVDNAFNCAQNQPPAAEDSTSEESEEAQELRMPVRLENEVQADTAVTSGEQFIAIPRDQPSAPCIGCSSHVNPEAAGVNDLASLGIRHLDLHEPTVKHTLQSVIDVERQVQVVNGVRYILTLSINFNNCTTTETETEYSSCLCVKICRISILVKPWKTLSSGAKYRSILANNCTEEWLFGDEGEILPEPTEPFHSGKDSSNKDGIIVERHEDIQSQPNKEKTLSPDEMKALEDQILSHDEVRETVKLLPNNGQINKDLIIEGDSAKRYNDNYVTVTHSSKEETNDLSEDKKKAINEILDIFNFSGFKTKSEREESSHRKKRSNSSYLEVSYKRKLVGGPMEKNPNDPKYLKLAEESLQKYLTESGNQQLHEVLRVVKASTQIVSGSLTRIEFVVKPSDSNNEFSCHSKIWEQPWLKKKDINITCQPGDLRSKRHMPGGAIEKNPNDLIYLELAKESLQKYLTESGNQRPHEVVRVVKVSKQVVSGSLTKIDFVVKPSDNDNEFSCHSEILEQPWLKKKDINITCQPGDLRLKRHMPGGATEKNPNDLIYLELAKESLQKYLTESGNQRPHEVVRVVKASKQVVSGSLTRIEFVVKPSDSNNEFSCHSKIWEQPWLKKKDINITCQPGDLRSKRHMPGGAIEKNPNDLIYLELAKESLQKYLTESGNQRPHEVVRVVKASKQVVSGSLTRIEFVVKPSDSNNEFSCHSKIWEQPWLKKKDINITCQPGDLRSKRHMPGGAIEKNPNDLIYLELAKESLQKYLTESGNQRPHEVVRVVKASKQVVSGSLTRIEFVVKPSDSNNEFSCISKIWEQPWLKKKDINITCQPGDLRSKRHMPGGAIEKNPNDLIYLELAKESLQKYLTESGNQRPHEVVRVVKASKQVVSGSLTRIEFVVKPSDSNNEFSCISKIWEQPWLKKKDINITCQPGDLRSKRHMLGGAIEKNPNDLIYLELAKESLQKYLTESGNQRPHEVVRVVKASKQVVSGSLTRIEFVVKPSDSDNEFSCHSVILEQPWLNKKDINITCQPGDLRSKRHMPGGAIEKNPNDLIYLELAKESLQKYLTESGNQRPHEVVRVVKASKQVVSGSLTRIEFVVKPSDSDNEFSCHSVILEQPWLNKKDINITCQQGHLRVKRLSTGGAIENNPDDPVYLELAKESWQKYLNNSGKPVTHAVVRVVNASTYSILGFLRRIEFLAKPSNSNKEFSCRSTVWDQFWRNLKYIYVSCITILGNRRSKRESNFELLSNVIGIDSEVSSDLVERDLSNFITDESIAPDVFKEKDPKAAINFIKEDPKGPSVLMENDLKATSNSIKENSTASSNFMDKNLTVLAQEDPKAPIFVQLAEESLRNYLNKSGIRRMYKVGLIIKVKTAEADGYLVKIDFLVTPCKNPNGDVFNCFSKILINAHNKKDINVHCEINPHKLPDLKKQTDTIVKKDPSLPTYLRLAQMSLQQFLHESGNSKPFKVVKVENVTTENFQGTWTRINFLASPIDNHQDTFKCFSTMWEHFWISTKETNVSCQIDDVQRHKYIPNGLTEGNPTDGKYIRLTKKFLNKYFLKHGNRQPNEMVTIKEVFYNEWYIKINFVVTTTHNSNYIMNCSLEVLEQNVENSDVLCFTNNFPKPNQKREGLIKENTKKYPNLNKNTGKEELTTNIVKSIQKREISEENHKNNLNKNSEKEENTTNPEYKLLAAQALRKYSKKSGTLHKLVEVQRVTKRVVAGLTYNIKFTAMPTDCSSDVSNARALSCKVVGNVDTGTVYCNAHIWDQPWIRKVKINVRCHLPDADYEDSNGNSGSGIVSVDVTHSNIQQYEPSKVHALAKEALESYLSSTKRKYFYKITEILSFHEQQEDGTVSNVRFISSPTVCLRDVYIDSTVNCAIKVPLLQYDCNARITAQPWLGSKKDIKVNCKKLYNNKISKSREKRHLNSKDLDEDVSVYYAEQAVKEVNFRPENDDLFHLVTIHNVQKNTSVTKMFIEISNRLGHKLCQANIFPFPKEKYLLKYLSVVCNDNNTKLESVATSYISKLINVSIEELQRDPKLNFKLVHQGESKIATLNNGQIQVNFSVGITNCTKNLSDNCILDTTISLKHCRSLIWKDTKTINKVDVTCENSKESANSIEDDWESESAPLQFYNNTKNSEIAKSLTKQALRIIEAKYPSPYKQKLIKVSSFKEVARTKHYRMKIELGLTNCTALSDNTACELTNESHSICTVEIWLDQLTSNPPLCRVYCSSNTGFEADYNQASHLFSVFLDTYKPTYVNDTNERNNRFEIFQANLRMIHNLNVFEKATATYGVTRFADLTYDEFRSKHTGLRKTERSDYNLPFMKAAKIPNVKMLPSYDWRKLGAMSKVTDQGTCAMSWAFSVVGNIENQIQIQTNKPFSLSVKKLVNCGKVDKICNEGLPADAYRHLLKSDIVKCLFRDSGLNVAISGGYNITTDEAGMARWLRKYGPIAVGVNAQPLQFYMGGVIHLSSYLCNSAKLDHSVLIVGYGEDDHPLYTRKIPYWIIKNSWGKNWGERGYYRLYRDSGTCGVNKMATSAIVKVDSM